MGTFTYGGKTPKKIMYNGAEVKRILFNGVEVWHKVTSEPEPSSKTVIIDEKGQIKKINYVVPDGITELKLYYCDKYTTTPLDYGKLITTIKVKAGDKEHFCFSAMPGGFGSYLGNSYLVQYQINDASPIVVREDVPTKFVLTWS